MKKFNLNRYSYAIIGLVAMVAAGIFWAEKKTNTPFTISLEEKASVAPTSAKPANTSVKTTTSPSSTALRNTLDQANAKQQAANSPKNSITVTPPAPIKPEQDDQQKAADTAEMGSEIPLSPEDLALPAPSNNNFAANTQGEYADQINQQDINQKTQTENNEPADVAPDSHPPTGNNTHAEPLPENAAEVNQQALIEQARAQGYPQEEIASDAPAASSSNATAEPQGDYGQEVNRQGLIDRAKLEGYSATDAEIAR